uniref:Uncharacterized protein n=1 Tax=uncultured marine virus TaxID=186617 RepID=A0A0F7L5V6_9VIRU|nr:hypothetical protein [uncultured marine virus]
MSEIFERTMELAKWFLIILGLILLGIFLIVCVVFLLGSGPLGWFILFLLVTRML